MWSDTDTYSADWPVSVTYDEAPDIELPNANLFSLIPTDDMTLVWDLYPYSKFEFPVVSALMAKCNQPMTHGSLLIQ